MQYSQKLNQWFKQQKDASRFCDIKFFPDSDIESVETMSRAIYEVVIGKRTAKILDTSNL